MTNLFDTIQQKKVTRVLLVASLFSGVMYGDDITIPLNDGPIISLVDKVDGCTTGIIKVNLVLRHSREVTHLRFPTLTQ
jgi:hypothetical protein